MSRYSNLVERAVLRDMIAFLVGKGFNFSQVLDGEGGVKVTSAEQGIEQALATDESRMVFKKDGKYAGNVLVVLGNGEDVISDWSWPEKDESFDKAMDEFCKTFLNN